MSAGQSGKADGGQLEERIDLTSETESKLTQAQNLITTSSSNLPEALQLLYALEKRCRIGNDTPSLVKVCEGCLQLCKDVGDEESLISTIETLSTRRSQKSKAIGALVSKTLPWVLQVDVGGGFLPLEVASKEQKEIRDKLIVTLRDITDGKIFLEAERARLTRALAVVKETDGDVPGAANILQEVHVETYSSLSKREKVEFILEQIRLTLGKRDFVRAAIVANKINRKVLNEEGMEDEKIKFFTLMTEYHRHEKDAFELAKDYHYIYLTFSVQNKQDEWMEALKSTVLFLVLSPYSREQQDMLNRVNVDSNLQKIDTCKNVVKLFLTKEILHHPLPQQAEMEGFEALNIGDDGLSEHWKETFKTRIIQHDVRVAAMYYQRIHGKRLAELLRLSPSELEGEIANMVSNGDVYAKIDRPNDIIRFAQKKAPEAVLSDWADDISSLLTLVDKTTHLIHKEKMTH